MPFILNNVLFQKKFVSKVLCLYAPSSLRSFVSTLLRLYTPSSVRSFVCTLLRLYAPSSLHTLRSLYAQFYSLLIHCVYLCFDVSKNCYQLGYVHSELFPFISHFLRSNSTQGKQSSKFTSENLCPLKECKVKTLYPTCTAFPEMA